jgi:soluble lytic murein transglycosylase
MATPVHGEIYVYKDNYGVMHFSDIRHHDGYQPFREQVRPQYARRVSPRPTVRAWDGVIRWAGRSHGLSPALVKAVVHAESFFDPFAISPKGAQGLMQLMPRTADDLGVDDPFNPWQNIEGGTRYLSYLIQRFRGDLRLGLAAYNAGEDAVRRHSGVPPYRETRDYVARVLNLYRRYGSDFY